MIKHSDGHITLSRKMREKRLNNPKHVNDSIGMGFAGEVTIAAVCCAPRLSFRHVFHYRLRPLFFRLVTSR